MHAAAADHHMYIDILLLVGSVLVDALNPNIAEKFMKSSDARSQQAAEAGSCRQETDAAAAAAIEHWQWTHLSAPGRATAAGLTSGAADWARGPAGQAPLFRRAAGVPLLKAQSREKTCKSIY